MRLYLRHIILALTTVGAALALMGGTPMAGQAPAAAGNKIPAPGQSPPYKAPRTADGKPDFNGIWQSFVTADIDVQDHDAQPGPHPDIMGAYGAWPGGQGIVEGGEIPYKPEALALCREGIDRAPEFCSQPRQAPGLPWVCPPSMRERLQQLLKQE